ncbi:MAG: chitobiase/beta-hexosaminidase C-terminal domain-containing protein, partial [Lentisphaeria bacterium]|nr:chitobiase/beta-hexosaminidase C-terminal domain-containing protein [Lentisphaeria bacterium]
MRMSARLRLLTTLLGVLVASLLGETTLSVGEYAIAVGESGDVRVAVTGAMDLGDLVVVLELDPPVAELVADSFWVSATRITNRFHPEAVLVPADFLRAEGDGSRVRFWLQLSAEMFDSGWRIAACADESCDAVFGFSLHGVAPGSFALSFAENTPVATRVRMVNGFEIWESESVDESAGSVLVYHPAGPVEITPPGGDFHAAVEVVLSSEHATGIFYTTDGSAPTAGSTPYSAPFSLLGGDGEALPLRVLATGEGGSASSGEATFRFDLTPPSVGVNPLVTAAGKPALTGTISEADATVLVGVAGGEYPAVNHGDGAWTLDLALHLGGDLAEGLYEVVATATDPAGNSAVDGTANELEVDRTPPDGAMSVGPGNPAYVASVSVELALAVSGAAEMRFRNSDGDWGPWLPHAATLPWQLSAGDGAKTVLGEFRDAAGNALPLEDTVTLDTTPPEAFLGTGGLYGPLTWPGELSGTATDTGSGVARVEVRCGRADTSEFWDGEGWVPDGVWVTASGTVAWSVGLPEAALPEGVAMAVAARALDRAGQVQDPPVEGTFSYDGAPPAGEFWIESETTVAVTSASVTLLSDILGAAQMRFRVPGDLWPAWEPFAGTRAWSLTAGDGLKTVEAQYRDAALNPVSLSDTIFLDTAAPVTTIATTGGYGPDSWPGQVRGQATDATSGVVAVHVVIQRLAPAKEGEEYWDGSAWSATPQTLAAAVVGTSWSVPLSTATLLAGGDARNYALQAWAVDAAGNTESPAAVSTFLFDSSIPSGGFTIGDGNPVATGTQTVTLYCTVTAENPLEMRFRREDEVQFPETWQAFQETLSGFLLSAGEGTKTVYGEFRDTVSGNTLATSDSILLDLTAPTSTVLTAGTFSPASWPGALSGTAADSGPAGLSHVVVTVLRSGDFRYWNGSAWQVAAVGLQTPVAAGTWSLALGVGALTDGMSYLIGSQAVDQANNPQTPPASNTVAFDSSAPSGSFAVGAGNPVGVNTRFVTLSMAIEGAADMAFRNAGGAWTALEPYAGERAWTLTGGEGTKTVSARFVDEVGNVLEIEDTVVLDETAPASTPLPAAAYGPGSWPGAVTGTAADALSGVASVEVRCTRLSDGFRWNGTTWAAEESWLPATGTTAWSLGLAVGNLLHGESYEAASRATDAAGNTQPMPAAAVFLYDAAAPTSLVATQGPYGPATWPGRVEGTATDDRTAIASVAVRVLRVLGGTVSTWDGIAWQDGAEAIWLPASGGAAWQMPLDGANLHHGAAYTAYSRAVDG